MESGARDDGGSTRTPAYAAHHEEDSDVGATASSPPPPPPPGTEAETGRAPGCGEGEGDAAGRDEEGDGAATAAAAVAAAEAEEDEDEELLTGYEYIPATELLFNRVTDEIGSGQFGKVYRANCRGKPVAVKVMQCPENCFNLLQDYRKEAAIMKKLHVPNVVQFLGVCTTPSEFMIVTELLNADLSQVLQDPEVLHSLSLDTRLQIARETACGMSWLHGISHIIHCDLKPANLLLDESFHVKVCDFGLSSEKKLRGLNFDNFSLKGTLVYMPPERLSGDAFNEKSDVYSYGLILYELFTGLSIYEHHNNEATFIDAVTTHKERPKFPENHGLPAKLVQLIESCWDPVFKNRPRFSKVLASLEALNVEVVLGNTKLATFWEKNFFNPFVDSVNFTLLVQKLQLSLDKEFVLAELEGLNKLLRALSNSRDRLEPVVTMKTLKYLNECFGDFFYPPDGYAVAHEMCLISTKPWFHFSLVRPMADSRLSGRPPNTFLVRLGTENPAAEPFTISKMSQGRVTLHRRVQRLTATASSTSPSLLPSPQSEPSTATSTVANPIPQMTSSPDSCLNVITTTRTESPPALSATSTITATTTTMTSPCSTASPPSTPIIPGATGAQPRDILSVALSRGRVVQAYTLTDLIDALVKMGALGAPCPQTDPASCGTPNDDWT
ncbi:SHK1 protein [Pelomyxa schiedti]|nr:SHK1 protein [Pelomyxa schiedti]